MAPNTAVIYVPAGIELDLRDEHLGHPHLPGLLGELYSPGTSRRFQVGVLQCPQCRDMDPDCPEWMFLRRGKTGLLHAVHHNPGIRDHEDGESDAHKALKERIAVAAQNHGLDATVESQARDGKRRTDVLVRGGEQDIAFEAQISYASKSNIQRRTKRAWSDGLTPLWATPNLKAPLVDVAPWAGINRMSWDRYRSIHELPVISGVRKLKPERCGKTGRLCPDRKKGRRCPGWHFTWAPEKFSNLDNLVVKAAYGEWVPHDHRTSRNTTQWFWVLASDAAQVEPDLTPRVPRQPAAVGHDADTRELDPHCNYGQDTGYRAQSTARVDEIVVVSARPALLAEQPASAVAATPAPAIPGEMPAQGYRRKMINPGTLPVPGAREDLATANLDVFLTAVRARATELDEVPIRHRVAELAGEPVRNPAADRDGRFGWDLPLSDGRVIRLLMPGVALPLIRDDLTAQAPCLYVNGVAWWWSSAVGSVASEGLVLRTTGRMPDHP